MMFERGRGPGTWEEVREMLVTVGGYFLEKVHEPMGNGPFLYGEGGLAIWKRLDFPFDLGRTAMMALDEPGFDEERWEEKGDTKNIIGYTLGGSPAELEWLDGIVDFGLEEKDDPRIEIRFIGEEQTTWAGIIRSWIVSFPGTFEVLYQRKQGLRLAEYFYIYRRDGWLSPVLDGEFQGAGFGISARGEGLYWNFAWTEEPLNGESLLWGGRRRGGPRPREHWDFGILKQRVGLDPVWAWGYVPLEDILWMDYGVDMHLTANRCKVVGGMLQEIPAEDPPMYRSLSHGYVAASDTKRGRFIPLVEYLQNAQWL